MPYSDEFVALCLILAEYDVQTSLAVIRERHDNAGEDGASCTGLACLGDWAGRHDTLEIESPAQRRYLRRARQGPGRRPVHLVLSRSRSDCSCQQDVSLQ